jgi:hypothetical protein
MYVDNYGTFADVNLGPYTTLSYNSNWDFTMNKSLLLDSSSRFINISDQSLTYNKLRGLSSVSGDSLGNIHTSANIILDTSAGKILIGDQSLTYGDLSKLLKFAYRLDSSGYLT